MRRPQAKSESKPSPTIAGPSQGVTERLKPRLTASVRKGRERNSPTLEAPEGRGKGSQKTPVTGKRHSFSHLSFRELPPTHTAPTSLPWALCPPFRPAPGLPGCNAHLTRSVDITARRWTASHGCRSRRRLPHSDNTRDHN